MSLILLSVNESDIGSDFDRFALTRLLEDSLRVALRGLIERGVVDEALLLSTCARTEIYIMAGQFHSTIDEVAAVFAEVLQLSTSEVQPVTRVLYGKAAIRHLLRVAGGIESAVVGESEILAQIKQALSAARESKIVRASLGRYFERALEVGKRIRNETLIGSGHVSVTSAAALLAILDEDAPRQSPPRVGVVGSGAIGSEVARVLVDKGATVTIMSSSDERRSLLEREFVGVRVASTSDLVAQLGSLDTLVMAGSSEPLVLDAAMLDGLSGLRIIDLCRPRTVDRVAAQVAGVTLLDLDDVNRFVSAQLAERMEAVDSVELIIESELEDFGELVWLGDMGPVLRSLYEEAERVRSEELVRTLRRLGENDQKVVEELELLTHRIVSKLLHQPAASLRQRAGTDGFAEFLEDFKMIFQL
ncbi:MAG: glutamyl-tRNA reductase [Ferrimicrobium sp.]|jgi:glutamyl-tRNA reductase|uniref:Glutamyl-tRNA reductase n=1 Tax=Ferrimicrobium acidiphilum TaxID=121039 RepID=A0ABV3Y5B5_9ACTN|nr:MULTISPECIES: glutamyl-tRNA reductase [Ferrimicrobium]